MPHVVTQSCCSDASCVYACPVNCIHPTPDAPDFLQAEMLYIDPEACVDCGACAEACPVDAIVPHTKLQPQFSDYEGINAEFYREPRSRTPLALIPISEVKSDPAANLRVAVVGSGPAALYAADELLKQRGVQVNLFEKLPTPHGLVRYGVAPDHQSTKKVTKLFAQIADQDNFEYYLGVEVGKDVSAAELAQHHHAVVYAYGASGDRSVAIPGEDLPGSVAATEFVAWYNGHPEHANRTFDLSSERAVIIGNGNVALDVARILTTNPEELAATDIARPALAALRKSKIREVVILGRRGVAQAAYTLPEFHGLIRKHNATLVIDKDELALDAETTRLRSEGALDPQLERKLSLAEEVALHVPGTDRDRRIVFRYLTSPTGILGDSHATGVSVVHNTLVTADDGTVRAQPTATSEVIETGLVLRSVGYRGKRLDGVPFDDERFVIPNEGGRVLGRPGGSPVPGQYTCGWIKRGPSGFIGTNKSCAKETVDNLIADFNAGLLPEPASAPREFQRILRRRQPNVIDSDGWARIDQAERARGEAAGAIRWKITDVAELVESARGAETRGVSRFVQRMARR
ncbi:FAD-dependent oxidoreductase [Hoyosella sp. YIM 151337]|uniref:FAD-dependent oxidoreductase n=1 Tax=Hoyosella sp. YIM 151337 TaxID=2992742 RepID=UPI0022355EDD|nr:FAD-dependent oxidoreductase [Hoyosella sp. YIM 151337]MCW4351855.1 FAD-dependent oxidoreductase [Hoyosella sp. YIM 151337]